jgi:hypothetical protein
VAYVVVVVPKWKQDLAFGRRFDLDLLEDDVRLRKKRYGTTF